MSWITQKTGIINHSKDFDFGTQPIKVLHWMNVYMFKNTSKSIFKELDEAIKQQKLNRELKIVYAEESIRKENGKFRTPVALGDSKMIELHETFLSYLWCTTYSIYVRYLETIDYPFCNKKAGYAVYPISQENIEEAETVFDYAKSLIVSFTKWDKNELPNPEIYLAEKRDYVEQTNIYYTEAVRFILFHEFTHLKHHIDKIDEHTSDSHYLVYEKEADSNAIDNIIESLPTDNSPLTDARKIGAEIGIIIGILSMFFFKATTDGKRHPNSEDRLTNALLKLDYVTNDYIWGIACVGLKMWDEQFELGFNWREDLANYRYLYFSIIDQVKALEN